MFIEDYSVKKKIEEANFHWHGWKNLSLKGRSLSYEIKVWNLIEFKFLKKAEHVLVFKVSSENHNG
jgi:hypothetical protein